jgi:hypothetical protein
MGPKTFFGVVGVLLSQVSCQAPHRLHAGRKSRNSTQVIKSTAHTDSSNNAGEVLEASTTARNDIVVLPFFIKLHKVHSLRTNGRKNCRLTHKYAFQFVATVADL